MPALILFDLTVVLLTGNLSMAGFECQGGCSVPIPVVRKKINSSRKLVPICEGCDTVDIPRRISKA